MTQTLLIREVIVKIDERSEATKALETFACDRTLSPGQAMTDLILAARRVAQKSGISEGDFLTMMRIAGHQVPLGIFHEDQPVVPLGTVTAQSA